ncbi:MAG: WD40/YVTN/BNR-like repeat-containing protein [Thermoanaerobaculia bacterium]
MRRILGQIFAGISILLTLTDCSRISLLPGDPYDPSGRTPLISRGGLDRQGVEGGTVLRIRPAAALGCTDFGIPASTIVATYGVWAAALSPGDDTTADTAWYLVGTTPLNTAGKVVNTLLCTPDKILVGSDKGLEWVSKKDLTSGTFASTLFNGNGVSAILPLDATHVLAGIQGAGGTIVSGVVTCDLAALTCSQPGAGFTGFSAYDQVAAFYRFPGGTILAGSLYSGIYRSTDGGHTWTAANSGLAMTSRATSFVGSGTAVFVAINGGVYESTTDGQSWTLMSTGLGTGLVFPTGLAGDGTTMYTGLNSTSDDEPATIWKTTNGGASWHPVGTGLTAINVNDLATTSAAVWVATNAGVFRSTDGGATWTPFNRGLENTYVYRVVASGGTLFAGTYANSNGVFRSTDGGITWQSGNALMNNRRIRTLAVVGSNVVASGESGVWRSTDGGVTFAASGSGLPSSARPYAMAVGGGTIFAGLYPNGFASSADGGATWVPGNPPAPDAFITAIAASGSTLAAAAGGIVYRSPDRGATWTPGAVLVPTDSSYLVYALTFSGGTLFAGLQGYGFVETHGLLRSTDLGVTWTRSQNGIPTNVDVYDVQTSGAELIAGTGRGLYVSTDGGTSWTSLYADLASTSVLSIAVVGTTLHAGTYGRGLFSVATPAAARRMLPVVADVNTGSAHFTTDAAFTNTGTTTANLSIQYTASLGSGSGTVTDTLAPGQQLLVPDVMAWLRNKNLPIPQGGSQLGTLVVTYTNLSDPQAAGLVARTTSPTTAPQPAGDAGLAYPSVDPALGSMGKLRLYGLRQNAQDRSNVALYNTSDVPVTLKATVYSGDGSGASGILDPAVTLPPWGWKQYTKALQGFGFATGWAEVERVSESGSFGVYGVINDFDTNDASYIPGVMPVVPGVFLDIPVIVETPNFQSELVLTNASSGPMTFKMTFTESLASAAATSGSGPTPLLDVAPVQVILDAKTIEIHGGAVDWLRSLGANIPPMGMANYGGALHVEISGGSITDADVGARTSNASPAGGEFGLYMPALRPAQAGFDTGWIFGLPADEKNRSNLALINTAGTTAGGNITLQIRVFDGDLGGTTPVGTSNVTLAPDQWWQWNGILSDFGIKNGYVNLEKISGTAPFYGYASRNDGQKPGDRTGDGSYLQLVTRYTY